MQNQETIEKIQNFLNQYSQIVQTRDDLAAQLQSAQNSMESYEQALTQISNVLNNLSEN